MIGAIVFELKAVNSDSLPLHHGQQLHGLCFKIMEDFSPALADHVHKEMSIKPFTSAMLEYPQSLRANNNRLYIKEGTMLRWRVTALQDHVLQAFLNLQPGHIMNLGNLQLEIVRIIINPEISAYSGLIEPTDLLAECFSCVPPSVISLKFHSATTFRAGNDDFPWPLPEYVFGSLADKWVALDMPGDLPAKLIREEAKAIVPLEWQGRSCKLNFAPKRSARGFVGQFTYGLNHVDDEYQNILLLLAAYAELAGIGRWTAHGMGQVRIIR